MRSTKAFFRKIFPWIVLAHAVAFLAFWLTNRLFYSTTNDYLADMLDSRRDYIRICLILAGVVAVWSLAQVWLSRWDRTSLGVKVLGAAYTILGMLFLAFFYGSFQMLFSRSPSQLRRIGQMLGYFRTVPDALLLLGVALLGAWWLRRWRRQHPASRRGAVLRAAAPFLAAYAVVWILALAFPPGPVYRGALPEKPRVIAHRGTSMLAPENTLLSTQRAIDLGAYGVEFDVVISQDGIPYLLHDDTLKRTTNVAQVFPGREGSRAETFTLAEVQQLEAGSWFERQDPFGTIAGGIVSGEDLAGYAGLAVPTLADELELLRKSGLIFLFDLKQPPEGHPYHDNYFDVVFQQVKQAGMYAQIWYLVAGEQALAVQAAAPQMKLASPVNFRQPAAVEELLAAGYQVVNSDFGLSPRWIRAYQRAGLWVNLYTVEEAWQFSRLWLLGVDSITTSNAGAMLRLPKPVWGISFSGYVVVWSLLGLLGVALAAVVVSFHPAGRPGV